jgi:hypothetical protein
MDNIKVIKNAGRYGQVIVVPNTFLEKFGKEVEVILGMGSITFKEPTIDTYSKRIKKISVKSKGISHISVPLNVIPGTYVLSEGEEAPDILKYIWVDA